MGKHKSRATRCGEVIGNLESAVDSFEDLADRFEQFFEEEEAGEDDPCDSFESLCEEAMQVSNVIDFSDVQTLHDEIESWRDSMEGSNLEYTDKYMTLDDCADNLQSAIDTLESLDFNIPEDREEIVEWLRALVDYIRDAVDALESCEFPGMCG